MSVEDDEEESLLARLREMLRAPDFSAVRANARLELHEAVCDERQKATLEALSAINLRLTAVSNRMWATASAMILLSVAGIASLLVLIITRGLK